MKKPVLKLCCPGCGVATMAMVWNEQSARDTFDDHDTIMDIVDGAKNGMVLQTIDAEMDELVIFEDCKCQDKS